MSNTVFSLRTILHQKTLLPFFRLQLPFRVANATSFQSKKREAITENSQNGRSDHRPHLITGARKPSPMNEH